MGSDSLSQLLTGTVTVALLTVEFPQASVARYVAV